ncbi:phytanoyl-CoA dioxygenase family protein [Novosphingobium sp. Chol11]|uniref:phytanoyl-CoA dioxygenase family protein n=1 Tax=Novosphingobium sp. Chol11 TaxID=1385763 RepID=UPI000BE30057|nr:phytanoyl-CoA dioxygenase family protein [Novosphingobium sp. Chol11]
MYSPTDIGAADRARLADLISVYASSLVTDGYVIIPEVIDSETIARLDSNLAERFESTAFSEGAFYGSQTKRFGRLLLRSEQTAKLVQNELIVGIVNEVLKPWCDVIQLNLTQAVEVHPGSPNQVPHRDQDMWKGPKGEMEYLVNVMWPTTPFTAETGATIVWPHSHRHQDQIILPPEDSVDAEMLPGSALLFLGSTLHGAGQNVSSQIRRGVIISYSLGWLKPYENQWLAYPPEIAKTFSSELAALVGYQQHRPNLGNFEGQCPSVLLNDVVPDHLHAIDSLLPQQEGLIAAYREGRPLEEILGAM